MPRTKRSLLILILILATRPLDAQTVTVEGNLVIASPRHPEQFMEVRIERQGSELIASTYADDSGRFAFRNIRLETGEIYYVRADIEGFEPYRERLDRQIDVRVGGHITVMLEQPAVSRQPSGGSAGVVDLRELLADIPEQARELYERAVAESEKGNAGGSIDLLLEALDLAPDYAEAHNHLGRQYLDLSRVDDARLEFIRAGDLRTSWVIPRINLGTLEYQQGELLDQAGHAAEAQQSYVAAVMVLESAVRADPLSPMAHSMLGAALYKRSDLANAETLLLRALALNDDLDEARLSLINVYSRQGRLADAFGVVTDFLDRNPEAPQAPALERVQRQLEELLAR